MSEEMEKTATETQEQEKDQLEQTQSTEQDSESAEVKNVQFENFDKPGPGTNRRDRVDLLMDIVLPVSIELGRTKMYVKDILELERGSIIELDKMAGEPIDLFINNKKMAEGEVVVVDKHFGIRITNLIDPENRIKNLAKDA